MEYTGKEWKVTHVWRAPFQIQSCAFCESGSFQNNYRVRSERPGAELTINCCGKCFDAYIKPPEAKSQSVEPAVVDVAA